MLWNKRKASDSSQCAADFPDRSGSRVAEADRALTAVGTLLQSFGRHAFDTDVAASSLAEQCEDWARRILLGDSRRGERDEHGAARANAVERDFRGAERFFAEQRKRESAYIGSTLGGLRRALLALGRALSSSVGDDREADAGVEARLGELSRALERGDVSQITRAASGVIEVARASAARRREREARQSAQLGKELRLLREVLAEDPRRGPVDELTGLLGRPQYDQQLEQLCALGALLDHAPWLVVIEVTAGKREPGREGAARQPRPVPDATLRSVGHSVARTFLRRHDFAARTAANELCVLVVDMKQSEVAAAVERLLADVYNAGRALGSSERPCLAVGVARLRGSDDPERWRERAELGVQRAVEDGRDSFSIVP